MPFIFTEPNEDVPTSAFRATDGLRNPRILGVHLVAGETGHMIEDGFRSVRIGQQIHPKSMDCNIQILRQSKIGGEHVHILEHFLHFC